VPLNNKHLVKFYQYIVGLLISGASEMQKSNQLKNLSFTVILKTFLILIIFIFPDVSTAHGFVASQQDSGSPPIYLPIISVAQEISWSMLGANPQRTSWVPEEVPGNLKPLWYKKFEAYIPSKVQIITAYSTLYISTANGLYAIDADTGAEKWVYPTELPLGHSPTVYKGVVYVAGFDKMLHAINAYTGQRLWTFSASAGFDTNPLVVGGLAMLGNRDGYFYAIHTEGPDTGQLAWKYQTGGPIDFSAAFNDGVVYFASQDSYAYALQAQDGSLVWKSAKLPGSGFQAWWPVIYEDWVIFSGSNNYRDWVRPGPSSAIPNMELDWLYPNHYQDPRGTLVGPLGAEPGNWAPNTPTIDTSKAEKTTNGSTVPVTEYFEQKPWRRTYFVLNKNSGTEYTSDFDHDGKPEYAPILWQGTHSGNRFPPVVGKDNVLYQANNYLSDQWIAGSQISGWKLGTPFISLVSSDWAPVDEPLAYSAGGNLIYWDIVCDREAGSFNISIPNTRFATRYQAGIRPATGYWLENRESKYFDYNLNQLIPGYNMYYNGTTNGVSYAFGSRNGDYGCHGLQDPPIPYQGKVYMHRGNSVIAFAPQANSPKQLPMAKIVPYQDADLQVPSVDTLKSLLADEVQKAVHAGHLRTGYFSNGLIDNGSKLCGDNLLEYWHNPGDILVTLIQALPYLSPTLQDQTKAYLQTEFTNFPPYLYDHIGWKDGAAREAFILPPEVEADRKTIGPVGQVPYDYDGWHLAPTTFYALWKYAQVFGGAQQIYNSSKGRLEAVPSENYLIENPHVNNAYIAGYMGFLELEKLAGYPVSTNVKNTLQRILLLRINTFSKDNPDLWFEDNDLYYCRSFSVARNFMYMVPELAQYLHDNINAAVGQAVDEYSYVAPYWFEAKPETAFAEGAINQFYDYPAIFAAKAMILQQPYTVLAKYIDVPAAPIGDLFYIQNLILAIEAGSP
jgi:hypothetical protein